MFRIFGWFGPSPNWAYAIGRCCQVLLALLLTSLTSSVYSVHGHMVDSSDFICGTHMDLYAQYVQGKYFVYLAHICKLMAILISYMYMPKTCQVGVLVVVFWHICATILGLFANTKWEQCEVHLQYGSHICSVINGNLMKYSLWSMYIVLLVTWLIPVI